MFLHLLKVGQGSSPVHSSLSTSRQDNRTSKNRIYMYNYTSSFVCLIGCFVGWLVGCLFCWLVVCFVGWLFVCLFCFVGWLFCWLLSLFVCLLVGCFVLLID